MVILKFGMWMTVIQSNVPLKTGIRVGWIRGPWIAKHGFPNPDQFDPDEKINNWAQIPVHRAQSALRPPTAGEQRAVFDVRPRCV